MQGARRRRPRGLVAIRRRRRNAMPTLRTLLLASLGPAAVLFGPACSGERKPRLDGAGSTFVDPIMQEWASIYKKDQGVTVNYQSKGSSAGISMMTGKEVQFGCSDAPLNEEQMERAK